MLLLLPRRPLLIEHRFGFLVLIAPIPTPLLKARLLATLLSFS
jgi:hypothetical protein